MLTRGGISAQNLHVVKVRTQYKSNGGTHVKKVDEPLGLYSPAESFRTKKSKVTPQGEAMKQEPIAP